MQKRIEKIKEYFMEFNIAENIVYVKIKLPNKWQRPDDSLLSDYFKCKIAPDSNIPNSFYFFSELTNGVDNIFDAIDFTILFNKDLEEKTQLLTIKINELKELFATKSLDELKCLKIEIDIPKKKNTKKKNKIKEPDVTEEVKKDENLNEEVKKDENVSDMDSLLAFASNMIEEDNLENNEDDKNENVENV